jgi:hypothetical protein
MFPLASRLSLQSMAAFGTHPKALVWMTLTSLAMLLLPGLLAWVVAWVGEMRTSARPQARLEPISKEGSSNEQKAA